MNWNYYYYADQTGAGGIEYMPFRGTVLQSGYGSNFRYYNQRGRWSRIKRIKRIKKLTHASTKEACSFNFDSYDPLLFLIINFIKNKY